MTPYELNLAAEVYTEKLEQEQEEKVTLVWLGEYYHRIKKLPALKDVLKKNTTKTAMSDKEMLAKAKMLNQLFGGKEITLKKEG